MSKDDVIVCDIFCSWLVLRLSSLQQSSWVVMTMIGSLFLYAHVCFFTQVKRVPEMITLHLVRKKILVVVTNTRKFFQFFQRMRGQTSKIDIRKSNAFDLCLQRSSKSIAKARVGRVTDEYPIERSHFVSIFYQLAWASSKKYCTFFLFSLLYNSRKRNRRREKRLSP